MGALGVRNPSRWGVAWGSLHIRRATVGGCGGSLVGIYLWESVAAANAFYTPDWVAMVTTRWAGPPQRQEWETPMVVESAERRLVAAE